MEIQSTRLDAGNPFARQQQLASSVRHALNRLPPKTRAQVLAQAMPVIEPPHHMPQSAVSYRVPVPVVQATAAQAQPVYPTVVYRPQRVAQTVPWQLALLINGIRLTRRAKKVWARDEGRQEGVAVVATPTAAGSCAPHGPVCSPCGKTTGPSYA